MSKPAKKPATGAKRPSGKHLPGSRKPVQMPTDWMGVAKALAAERKMPAVWYLVDLVKQAAEAAGVKDLPPAPWEGADRRGD